jgi:hypothetical protein
LASNIYTKNAQPEHHFGGQRASHVSETQELDVKAHHTQQNKEEIAREA